MNTRSVTAREIARHLGAPIHRVQYALRRLGAQPAQVVGHIRLFEGDVLAQVRATLKGIEARRTCAPDDPLAVEFERWIGSSRPASEEGGRHASR